MSDAGSLLRPPVARATRQRTDAGADVRRRRALHLQVFLRLAPILAGVFVVSIAVSAWFGYRSDQRELHDKLSHVIGNQSIVLAEPLSQGEQRHIGLMAAGIMADPDITYARLTNANGEAILVLGTPPDHGVIERQPVRLVQNGTILTLGQLEIGASYSGALSTLLQNLATSLTGALLATLASWAALMVILNRVVGMPVRHLREEIDAWRRPSQGLSTDETTRGDEIISLTEAFDALKLERRHHEDALQSLLDDLERRVEQRTRAMRQARDAAQRANAAKADFLAAMSHEIRTPMNAILGIAHALSESDGTGSGAVSLGVLRDSGRQLISLLDEILDLSKIEAGKLAIGLEPTDLAALTQSVGEMWRPEASARGVALRIDIAADMPEHVMADGVRLRQCLGNLVSNAVKFTEEGSITISLDIDGVDAAGHPVHRLSVRDTGPGIAPESLAAIFEPFVQGGATGRPTQGGTGLGLAITRRLMRLMGGDVSVETVPGEGACFVMRFPAETVIADAAATAQSDREDGAAPDLTGVRVLVVDDVPTNRYVARLLLEPAGTEVLEADSGAAALALLATTPVDLVLLDLHMPDMDGFETVERIRALASPAGAVRMVVLTADTRDALQDRLHALPIDAIMTKPFDAVPAIRTIGRILGRTAAAADAAPQPEPETLSPDRA